VRQECGITGSGPSTVVGQTGELNRIVDWTSDAYIEIQNSQRWNWLWVEFTRTLTAGGRSYDPVTDWSIFPIAWDKDAFSLYVTSAGVADEQPIGYMPWPTFKATAGYGYGVISTGRPVVVSIKPDRTLVFDATLNTGYTFKGEYWGTPETLSLDADLPAMPEQYQMAIVWKAVMSYATYEEAGVLYTTAKAEYDRYYGNMVTTELPLPVFAGALA